MLDITVLGLLYLIDPLGFLVTFSVMFFGNVFR